MKHYVVGFYLSAEAVLLIEKQRPRWQKSRMNGIGGSVEPGEIPLVAMVREFQEETGIIVSTDRWKKFCELNGTTRTDRPEKLRVESHVQDEDFTVHFFTATKVDSAEITTQTTDETPIWWSISALEDPRVLPNLRWLIPMASAATQHDWPYRIFERAG